MNFEILKVVTQEIERAKLKHPDWPIDPIHAAAIVGEETGELIRAAIQFRYEGGKITDIETEAVQVIATAVRLLENLGSYYKSFNV